MMTKQIRFFTNLLCGFIIRPSTLSRQDRRNHLVQTEMSTCIVNIGLYRTGSTTLAKAAQNLNLRIFRKFPNLSPTVHKTFLLGKQDDIDKLLLNVMDDLLDAVKDHDLVCDGYFPLLPLASQGVIDYLKNKAANNCVLIQFIATERNIQHESYIRSELHHWILHDLERKSGIDCATLEESIVSRQRRHQQGILRLGEIVKRMDLNDVATTWANTMSNLSNPTIDDWNRALSSVGRANCSPKLPIEAILLTMRMGNDPSEKLGRIKLLLSDIEEDILCSYMVVMSVDEDEYDLFTRYELQSSLGKRSRMVSFHYIKAAKQRNKNEPLPICSIWHKMADVAFENGASWVILLGDDIRIHCKYHYRAIYRSFLDIRQRLNLDVSNDQMFGSPWFDDIGFKVSILAYHKYCNTI